MNVAADHACFICHERMLKGKIYAVQIINSSIPNLK